MVVSAAFFYDIVFGVKQADAHESVLQPIKRHGNMAPQLLV